MPDPVQLLLLPGVLMLLDHLGHIVIYRAAGYDPGLAPAVHGQLIDIIAGPLVLDKGAVCHPGL